MTYVALPAAVAAIGSGDDDNNNNNSESDPGLDHPSLHYSQTHDAVSVLKFADLDSDLARLQPSISSASAATTASSTSTITNTEADAPEAPLDPVVEKDKNNRTRSVTPNVTTANNSAPTHPVTTASKAATEASAPSSTTPPSPPRPSTTSPGSAARSRPAQAHISPHVAASTVRKTSPGLAARLKALGIGTSEPTPNSLAATPDSKDHIGRLNEDQLRQLDQRHRAGSITSTITRRGRPWKGPSAASSPPRPSDIDNTADLSPVLAPQLPEIDSPELLAMDTQKYRLPDHTNDNGTKATLETRREHLDRKPLPPSPDEVAPSPPPSPPTASETPQPATPSNDYVPGLGSYFTPGHNRPGSIYTLSRASFANQLNQLTSLQLPDAESLSSKVSAIPTAPVATTALINAAEQIRSWISKASEVIGGLDSEDDVEWAAAGGREGLVEVEIAITRFEDLINVYVGAIEELQSRDDIVTVAADDLKRAVSQMEAIIHEWAKIRDTLRNVRGQVEIAMEWEELWNNVLGDIQGEMDELVRLVFEMEERRHKSLVAAAGGDTVDLGDLQTIVEDTPPQAARLQAQSRMALSAFPMSPTSPGTPTLSQDDSSLLALFARMQPLRASLDFLPMRLSVFETRAEQSFPTACEELEMRRAGLDASYRKLEKDAESLRKELGEDRWVIVFRGAGRQAQKMHESVERSLLKLKQAIDSGAQLTNQPLLSKKLESYEAKKTHYGPAIERVLSIIDKGVKDRLTVNGEILRLHSDLQARWESLKNQTREMDAVLEEVQVDFRSQQLRDSVSSMLSNDRSTTGSVNDTPGTSPPSSVIMSSLGFDPQTPRNVKARSPNTGHILGAKNVNRRQSLLPAPTSQLTKRQGSSRLSTIASSSVNTPVPPSRFQRPPSAADNRPRWNGSTNTGDIDTGHNFKPLSLTTPSPYARRTPVTQRSTSSITPSSSTSKLPTIRTPLGRSTSESPRVEGTPSRTGHSRLSFRERLASPGVTEQQALPKPRLATQASMSALSSSTRRASLQTSRTTLSVDDKAPSRPASSLASTSRRISLLPQPKGLSGQESGRMTPLRASSRQGGRSNASAESKDSKPRWRH
ncbi:hypothetical protein HJFPF1_00932 [Paramyrothecium foliicola]|nr:hypothetical protein HJFPF1_00932 [Paramyrothecium foliicola]